jgi:hypothetical protein
MRDDHKSTEKESQTTQERQTVYLFLCDFCASLWLKLLCLFVAKLKLETDFRRTVFVPRVPRILTSVA